MPPDGAVAELLPWLDEQKRRGRNALADVMANPRDTIWAALQQMGQNLGVVQTPEAAARDEALKGVMYSESPEGKQAAKDKIAEAMMGIGTGNMSAGALVGMLRPGGNPGLMLSHGLSGGLTAPGGGLIKELVHPSLAVTGGGRLKNPFGSESGVLIPKPGAFDPAYSTSTLFNRDAYLARTNEFPGGKTPSAEERVAMMGLLPPRKTEGSGSWKDLHEGQWRTDPFYQMENPSKPQDAAILASPAFRSFAEFEKSPKGAKLLGANMGDIQEWDRQFRAEFHDWWAKTQGKAEPYGQDWLAALRQGAKGGDTTAQELLRSAARAPSEYGELKVSGAVPITGDRWAGAILKPYELQKYGDLLADRGIPSAAYPAGYISRNPFDLHQIADAMQQMAGPVKERSLRSSAGWAPGQDQPPRPILIQPGGNETKPPSTNKPFDPGFVKQFDSKEDAMKAAGQKAGGAVSFHPSFAKAAQDAVDSAMNMDFGTAFEYNGVHFGVSSEGNVFDQGKPNKVILNLMQDVPQ